MNASQNPEMADQTPPDRIVSPVDLDALHAEAVAATAAAVATAVDAQAAEARATGERLTLEQQRLLAMLLESLPDAVREAASRGQRAATLLRFEGTAKLDEFCYLYMLKGPHTADQRAEMRAMGARPLLPRLRGLLRPSGFDVLHSWQRATNDNAITVTW